MEKWKTAYTPPPRSESRSPGGSGQIGFLARTPRQVLRLGRHLVEMNGRNILHLLPPFPPLGTHREPPKNEFEVGYSTHSEHSEHSEHLIKAF